jgi:5'-methylthioadenosine phosphorylase
MSTDYDCWHDTEDVNVAMVMANMKANAENARRFVGSVLNELSKEDHEEQVLAKHLENMSKYCVSTSKEGRSREAVAKLEWMFGKGYFD